MTLTFGIAFVVIVALAICLALIGRRWLSTSMLLVCLGALAFVLAESYLLVASIAEVRGNLSLREQEEAQRNLAAVEAPDTVSPAEADDRASTPAATSKTAPMPKAPAESLPKAPSNKTPPAKETTAAKSLPLPKESQPAITPPSPKNDRPGKAASPKGDAAKQTTAPNAKTEPTEKGATKQSHEVAEAYNRGLALFAEGKYDEAIVENSLALSLDHDYVDAYYNRGLAYYMADNYDQAVRDFTTAIRLNPKYANAYSNRGTSHYMKADYDTALRDYNEAIRLAPDHADAYYGRALTHQAKGNAEQFTKDRAKALELNPALGK